MREALQVLWWVPETPCRPSPTHWSGWRHLREHGRHRSRSPSAAGRFPAPGAASVRRRASSVLSVMSVALAQDPTGLSSPLGQIVVLIGLLASLTLLLRWWWQNRRH